ncbi:MAG: hypothetical protein KIT73_13860, partial [Burkholderiales bacterium]|nr:hypothetical protein [Burkholderiales bacterium]
MVHELYLFAFRYPTQDMAHVWWNDETGEIKGYGADRVRAFLERVIAEGYIRCKPPPCSIPATDGLFTDHTQMAAALALGWKLPDVLWQYYPRFTDDPEKPEDAVD